MRKSDELCAEVMKNAKLDDCCDAIEKLVTKRLEDTTGRFDWYKSEDGKLILEIQRLLRLRH
jgi:hypothetical protein